VRLKHNEAKTHRAFQRVKKTDAQSIFEQLLSTSTYGNERIDFPTHWSWLTSSDEKLE